MAVDLRSIAVDPLRAGRSEPGSIVAVVAIGLGVTIAAAIEPARRAGSIPPVEALRDAAEPTAARRARLRWLVGGLRRGRDRRPRSPGRATPGRPASARSGLVYLVLFVAVARRAVRPRCPRPARRPAVPRRAPGRGAARPRVDRPRPGRTTLTVGALAIGLAMVVAVGGVAHQSRLAASAWLDRGDPGRRARDLDPAGRPRRGRRSPTSRRSTASSGSARSRSSRSPATASGWTRPRSSARISSPTAGCGSSAGDRRGRPAGLDAGGVAILPRSVAERTGLTVGLDADAGRRRRAGHRPARRRDRRADAARAGRRGRPRRLAGRDRDVRRRGRRRPGRPLRARARAAARPELEAAARELGPRAEPARDRSPAPSTAPSAGSSACSTRWPSSPSSWRRSGIVNTLTVSVLERVRELGVLRAAGMTRGQVRRTVVVEAGILGHRRVGRSGS